MHYELPVLKSLIEESNTDMPELYSCKKKKCCKKFEKGKKACKKCPRAI